MRYNRKACLRAIQIAAHDATRLPFGLVFSFHDDEGRYCNGTRTCRSTYWIAKYKRALPTNDDARSVRFAPLGRKGDMLGTDYAGAGNLLPGLKPRSLKKH